MTRQTVASPSEIFFRLLDRIEDRFHQAQRPRALRDHELANGLRTDLFFLEGWAKLHRHQPKAAKTFAKLRTRAKELEDALGALTLAYEIADDLREKKEDLLALQFDQRASKAFEDLKSVLKKRDWFGRRVQSLRKDLAKIEWGSTEDQAKFMIAAMRDDCIRLEGRYASELKPDLLKDHYSREILETKLHKFRRQLRWISMYFQISAGLVALKPIPKKLSTRERKLVNDYQDDPFGKLPRDFKAVVHIDTLAFLELTRLIEILGQAKDPAERYYGVREVIDDSEKVREIYGDAPNEVPRRAHPILKEYERMKPLRALAANLGAELSVNAKAPR